MTTIQQELTCANWYKPMLGIRGKGEITPKASTLGGLHAARREHQAQFLTPAEVASYVWARVKPSIDQLLATDPIERVKIFDSSLGSGRLFMHIEQSDRIELAGMDIDEDKVNCLTAAAEQVGFRTDFHVSPMETTSPGRHHVALINPPFSLTLMSPNMSPLPSTSFGLYGPNTSALSHDYAIDQALTAAQVVIAIVPRSVARERLRKARLDESNSRLREVHHLSYRAFLSSGARVSTSILVFGEFPVPSGGPIEVRADLNKPFKADFRLALRSLTRASSSILPLGVESSAPAITLPITGDPSVRVAHDGRRLKLRFSCGLMKAEVLNHVYEDIAAPAEGHRLPNEIRFAQQSRLDIETYLAQPDPMACFLSFLGSIKRLGGVVTVAPDTTNFLRKRIRQSAVNRVPLARWISVTPDALPETGEFEATVKSPLMLQPDSWSSPVLRRGERITVDAQQDQVAIEHDGNVYRLDKAAVTPTLKVDAESTTSEWRQIYPGLKHSCPDRWNHSMRTARKQGLHRWLHKFQLEDIVELNARPTGAILGWTMGLGKGRAAAALCLIRHAKRNLIVVDPSLAAKMRNEFGKIGLASSVWQDIFDANHLADLREINLITYSRLRQLVPGTQQTFAQRLRRRVNVLVADEGELLRNDSLTSRSLWQVSAKRRYILTGEAVPNYARNTHPMAAFVAGDGIVDQPYGWRRGYIAKTNLQNSEAIPRGLDQFREDFMTLTWVTHQFADGHQKGAKREVPILANPEKFQCWLAPFFKRRLRDEPEVEAALGRASDYCRTTNVVEWDHQHLEYYKKISSQFVSWYRRHQEARLQNDKAVNMVAVLAKIMAVRFAANNPQRGTSLDAGIDIPLTSKQEAVIGKARHVAKLGKKVIIGVLSPCMAERLADALNQAGVTAMAYHGKQSIKRRNRDLKRFRDGRLTAMVCTFGVTKKGEDIYEAEYVYLYERCWTAFDERQFIARLDRPQQTEQIKVEHFHLPGSIDEYMAQVVDYKNSAARAGLDYQTQDTDKTEFLHMESIFDDFCSSFENGEEDRYTCDQGVAA